MFLPLTKIRDQKYVLNLKSRSKLAKLQTAIQISFHKLYVLKYKLQDFPAFLLVFIISNDATKKLALLSKNYCFLTLGHFELLHL